MEAHDEGKQTLSMGCVYTLVQVICQAVVYSADTKSKRAYGSGVAPLSYTSGHRVW